MLLPGFRCCARWHLKINEYLVHKVIVFTRISARFGTSSRNERNGTLEEVAAWLKTWRNTSEFSKSP